MKEKNKDKVWSWVGLIIGIVVILFLVLVVHIFGVSTKSHYDVKRGSLNWLVLMDNKTIKDFPVIKPLSDVQYNSLGGDSPSIGASWEMKYISTEQYDTLYLEISQYLESRGFNLKSTLEKEYSEKQSRSDNNTITFSSVSNSGEWIDMEFLITEENIHIKLRIMY